MIHRRKDRVVCPKMFKPRGAKFPNPPRAGYPTSTPIGTKVSNVLFDQIEPYSIRNYANFRLQVFRQSFSVAVSV